MDLYWNAINNDDFGLRECYAWTMNPPKAPWTTKRISHEEKSYIYSLVDDVFDWHGITIKRIENPYLWARYLLRREEMKANFNSRSVEEEIVIHATSLDNAYKIAEENFNWRLVSRHRFGRGVSFAGDAEYANKYAMENDTFIITGILIANSEVGNHKTHVPSYGSDTTTSPNETVYVKYNDNEYYPYYIVY